MTEELWQIYAVVIICVTPIDFSIPGIGPYLRKIALRLKLKKVIEQQGDLYVIKTVSTFKNYTFSFKLNQEFEEFTQGLDNRHVKVSLMGSAYEFIGHTALVLMLSFVFAVTGDMGGE